MAIDAKKYDIFVKIRGAEDADYKGLGCHLAYENLMHPGTRDLMGKLCAGIPKEGEPDDNGKRLKAKKFDNGSITYVYNPTATDGRKMIFDAFDNEEEDVKLTIKLVLNDKGAGTAGTYIERDVLVTSCVPEEDDDSFVEKATLEFLNAPKKTDKVA